MEIEFEQNYQEVYKLRTALINGADEIDQELVKQFDTRAEKLKADPEFGKAEASVCDVKAIQNTPKGVTDFWQRVLLNHPYVGGMISEKDRPILAYLANIELEHHPKEKGFGYDLKFTFEK